MSEPEPGLYARLESSFQAAPNLRQSKHLPRRSDPCRSPAPSTAPPSVQRDDSFTSQAIDDSDSTVCSQDSTLLESPGALNGPDSGLPPTPPTISQDGKSPPGPDQPPHADSVRNSLISQKSSLSTPVNARSPPTPDPSPPRTNPSHATLERPPLNTYPSSRATSYQTAREDPISSDREESRSATPANDRLSTVEEDRGLGLAFEQERDDVTPTGLQAPSLPVTPTKNAPAPGHVDTVDTTSDSENNKGSPAMDRIPNREWNTELMRNVTVRKKRRPQSQSPHKTPEPAVTVVESASPSPSPSTRARRASSLRKRVQVGHNSPVTPSVENFAQSIGWPADGRRMSVDKQRDSTSKRLSTASVSSTVVSAHVIVTPPQRKQTLRHSGKNMAYRRDISSPADLGSDTHSNRNSVVSQADSAPIHRLVHKRTSIADRNSRSSVVSDMSASQRIMSPSLSLRQRTIDSSAHTLAHQESVRHVLQPAADILSRHSAAARLSGVHHKRVNSAPEAARRMSRVAKPRNFSEISPPGSPHQAKNPFTQPPILPRAPTPTKSPTPRQMSPTSRKTRRSVVLADKNLPTGLNSNPPDLPTQTADGPAERDSFMVASHPAGETQPPSAMLDRVRRLLGDAETNEGATLVAASNPNPATLENLSKFPPLKDGSPIMRQGSRSSRPGSRTSRPSSSRPGSWDPKRFSLPLDRSSVSPDWHRYSGDHGHVSFDRSGSRSASRSASRAEEHAMARHLFSQSTPFSQFSDTVEVTEATAVSIYPHNNNSLLVVQQFSRGNTMQPEQRQLTGATHLTAQDPRLIQAAPTPGTDQKETTEEQLPPPPQQPTLTFEPSTPPMQLNLSHSDSANSVLENPRDPPEPPKINFIPPTPMEELEKPLAASPPGPPRRSDSHPQRRLSVLQRARRYSDNLITPLLARKGNGRARYNESEKHTHQNPHIPTVNDEDGTLHPFWRPRGFWDEFSDSEEESEDEVLPQGGDTSDVEDPEPEPEPPRRANTLKKFKGGFRGSGGFLIGNSLGVERHGTNKRRHHVNLPPHIAQSLRSSSNGSSSPKIIIQSPTLPLGRHGGGGISKRHSSRDLRRSASVPDNLSIEYEQSRRNRGSWRQGKRLPGLKKYHVQYIGISGVKERLKERRTEKRREKLRRSIGHRYYVDPTAPDSPISQ
ncbi:uncharacterized protein yc1106_03691 [Curvularia clavata]|uniref:Uncharacterized protein n=1 Tax=Curvularia clavata TaxID=95742 RepID=A0A9Q9DR96_CURCL|nr:uncharacterized protein yc1106_03691 [Curvularia clavata]